MIVVLAIGGTFKWREMPKAQGDDTPDDRWLGGLFYFNPDDPAMMVERRDNIGYTVNFAQPVGWVIVGGVVALLACVVWMATSAA